jgi:hypothetical protein
MPALHAQRSSQDMMIAPAGVQAVMTVAER